VRPEAEGTGSGGRFIPKNEREGDPSTLTSGRHNAWERRFSVVEGKRITPNGPWSEHNIRVALGRATEGEEPRKARRRVGR